MVLVSRYVVSDIAHDEQFAGRGVSEQLGNHPGIGASNEE
jgi:hypothetical protein